MANVASSAAAAVRIEREGSILHFGKNAFPIREATTIWVKDEKARRVTLCCQNGEYETRLHFHLQTDEEMKRLVQQILFKNDQIQLKPIESVSLKSWEESIRTSRDYVVLAEAANDNMSDGMLELFNISVDEKDPFSFGTLYFVAEMKNVLAWMNKPPCGDELARYVGMLDKKFSYRWKYDKDAAAALLKTVSSIEALKPYLGRFAQPVRKPASVMSASKS